MYVHVHIYVCSCTYTCMFMYIYIIHVIMHTHKVVHKQFLSVYTAVYIKIVFDIDVKF